MCRRFVLICFICVSFPALASLPTCRSGNVSNFINYIPSSTPLLACQNAQPYNGWTNGDQGIYFASASFTRLQYYYTFGAPCGSTAEHCSTQSGVVGECTTTYSRGVDVLSNVSSVVCSCPIAGEFLNNTDFSCSPTSFQLTLTPAPYQNEPRPKGIEGKDGKSTFDLIAKVTEGNTPKAGVAVTFKVDVIEKTGGHGHHDANRPKGSVPASGVTNANGEIKLTFQATEVAGSHNITATCDSCSNKTVVKKVDVLVPDLQPISPSPRQNADGSYQYAFTAVDPGHVGTSGGRQRGEYYLTAEAAENLDGLIRNFAKEGWGIVGLNDASLNWGGLYDLKNNWSKPHSEHRVGEEIDISFVRAGNIVSTAKQNAFYKKFCEDKKAEVPFSILHHYVLIPHFHVRLANSNKCGRTAH